MNTKVYPIKQQNVHEIASYNISKATELPSQNSNEYTGLPL